MEKYENLGLVGEGSYGMVMKCRHRETNQLVAIKKFIESEDDKMVKKIALREVKMLKSLRHDNLVNLLDVFRRKKRLFLVFEFVDHTVLDELEKHPNGLSDLNVKKIMWQVIRAVEFCHNHNIIHRDVKPENILVSKTGIVKICDFGFARTLAIGPGEAYTDYVATRWYRAPELLVGDTKYGKAVDVWAVGCLQAEMLTGEPLFPGDSDIDQIYHIVRCFGSLTHKHKEIFQRNPLFVGMRVPEVKETEPLERRFPRMDHLALDITKVCLKLDPASRSTCSELLGHEYFKKDNFGEKFSTELKNKISRETADNPLLNKPHSKSANTDMGDEEKPRRKDKKPKKETHSKPEVKDHREHKEHKDTKETKEPKKHKQHHSIEKQQSVEKSLPPKPQKQALHPNTQTFPPPVHDSPPLVSISSSVFNVNPTESSPSPSLAHLPTTPNIDTTDTSQSLLTKPLSPHGGASRHSPCQDNTESNSTHAMSSLTSVQSSSKPGVISFGLVSQEGNSQGPPAFKESKVKKQGVTHYTHGKKSTSNHHSSTLHSPSQDPKPYGSDSMTWLNDMVNWPDRRNSTSLEGTSKKKSNKEKERDHDRSSRMETDQLPFLPDLGIDGKSSRLGGNIKNTKKSSVSVMPHITSVTPFYNGQSHQAQSPPGCQDGRGTHDSNLPSV